MTPKLQQVPQMLAKRIVQCAVLFAFQWQLDKYRIQTPWLQPVMVGAMFVIVCTIAFGIFEAAVWVVLYNYFSGFFRKEN